MSTSPLVLAVDQGTSSSRAVVFDVHGKERASAQIQINSQYPYQGWVEQNPIELWDSLLKATKLALKQLPDVSAIACIGVTNQRETTVFWNKKTGEPIGPVISWQDRRTALWCSEKKNDWSLLEGSRLTGLPLDSYFCASKINWFLKNNADARALDQKNLLAVGTVDTWILWKLTNGAVFSTDVSNASRTLLFDIHTLSWNVDLLDFFDISVNMLPSVTASSGFLGETSPELFGRAIPIFGVAGDQQASLFGQACFKPGLAKNTYGTGCFLLMNVGEQPMINQQSLLSTVAWTTSFEKKSAIEKKNTCFAVEGSVFMGGNIVRWMRENLGIFANEHDVESLAASLDDCEDVYFVPAFSGLGAPYWDSRARGVLLGLTNRSTKAHMARAALEAIALQSVDVFQAMSRASAIPLLELRVDGRASQNNLLMQMQADFLGVPVTRSKHCESTAFGAAMLAGLAAGVWSCVDELTTLWQHDRIFLPSLSEHQRISKLERWHQAVERSLNWSM